MNHILLLIVIAGQAVSNDEDSDPEPEPEMQPPPLPSDLAVQLTSSTEEPETTTTSPTSPTPPQTDEDGAAIIKHYPAGSDYMAETDKTKLRRLANDLMSDMGYKIHQIDGILADHVPLIEYEVGFVIGTIREKYRLMMALYTEFADRYSGRTSYMGPFMPAVNNQPLITLYFMVRYERIRHIQLDLGQLIEVLEDIPEDELQGQPTQMLRAGQEKEDARRHERKLKMRQDEAKLKHRYREQYLLKKLNLPTDGSTKKKRFINQWPVEETWDLNNYQQYQK